jgi:succinate dehydrogenase / fumarate reductase membrane anchor subunit
MDMVANATSLSRNGLRDWLLQRFSAVVLGAYVLFLLFYFLFHPSVDYIDWSQLFLAGWVRYFTLAALFSLIVHSWIGIWTVVTDYVKSARWRLMIYSVVLFLLAIYFFWCLEIIFKWSVATWG